MIFSTIFFKTLHQNLWNLKSPWESLTCFTNISYITLLNTTMESKLIETKFSKFFSQEHNHETLNSRGFHGEIRKRSVSYLKRRWFLATSMIQQNKNPKLWWWNEVSLKVGREKEAHGKARRRMSEIVIFLKSF